MDKSIILDVKDLNIQYQTSNKIIKAVNNINLTIYKDEIFGLVGESGSGKSTLCYGLLNLLPPSARFASGSIGYLDDTDMLKMSTEELRLHRWKDISFIPQGAMSCLNPLMKIHEQFEEVLIDHGYVVGKKEMRLKIESALQKVDLEIAVAGRYPHELSGGMKQRVCIALAVILSPKLIVADEPTSALDVISQRIVLEMLSSVRQEVGASLILVGHDMALQAQVVDRIGIMLAGELVEIGPVKEIFQNPIHPYSRRLIASIPSIKRKQNIRSLAEAGLKADEINLPGRAYRLVEVTSGHFVSSLIEETI